jgi:hypothetical protein
MFARLASAFLTAMLARAAQAQVDCLPDPNWPGEPEMRLSVLDEGGHRVLVAEGMIDVGLPARLDAMLKERRIGEVRLRSPGGDARAGNEAGVVLRRAGVEARIPAGWACAGSCAFLFMGGIIRTVEPGGRVIATMFTHTGDREAIRQATGAGEQATEALLTDIARSSAQIATEDHDYVMRMGVQRAVLADIFYARSGAGQGSAALRCLTPAELERYNIVNLPAGRSGGGTTPKQR